MALVEQNVQTTVPSRAHMIAAKQAVSPTVVDGALHTPSWASIVEAYHKDGNGDREMLLALLAAKSKEDERLAALDLLKAEQLRAYSAHISVHGPLYTQKQQQQQQHHNQHYKQSPPAPSSQPSTSLYQTVRLATEGKDKEKAWSAPSRSPSLSASRSSPEADSLGTPVDERRLLNLCNIPPTSTESQHKRKRSEGERDCRRNENQDVDNLDHLRRHPHSRLNKRHHPYGTAPRLPGFSSFVAAATHPTLVPPGTTPLKSFRNILDSEPRHSMEATPVVTTRVATSDVRSSASEDGGEDRDDGA